MSPSKTNDGILSILKDFGGYTSVHGCGRFVEAGHFVGKVFWFLAIVTAFCMFSWQTSRLFEKFRSRPVNVEVKFEFKELEFPAVTVCNLNRFRSTLLQETPELSSMVDSFDTALAHQLSGGIKLPPNETSAATSTASPSRRRRRRKRSVDNNTLVENTTEILTEYFTSELPPIDITASNDFTETTINTTSPSTTRSTTPIPTVQSSSSTVSTSQSTSQSTSVASSSVSNVVTTENQNVSSTTTIPSDAPSTTSPISPQTTTSPIHDFDVNDEYFEPVINITNKPWFNQTNQPDTESEITKNITVALTDITTTKRRTIGHQVIDMVQECSWAGKQCYPGNFSGFTNRYYGNCYTFNADRGNFPLRTNRAGSLRGLRLTLFVEQDLYVRSLSPSAGFRVLIHARDEQPFPEDDGIDVSPGHKTSIGLRLREISRKGPPYGNCTEDNNAGKLLYRKKYSVPACLRSCSQRAKITTCKCADPSLPVPAHIKVCDEKNFPGSSDCIDIIDEQIYDKVIPCDCPAPCSQRVYEKSVSTSAWPADAYEKVIIEQFSKRSERLRNLLSQPGGVREELLKLEVFYEELNYESITEGASYEVENLLGDIGGQLGLWIGLSTLTLVEIVELFFKMGHFLIKRKRVNAVKSVHITQEEKMTQEKNA